MNEVNKTLYIPLYGKARVSEMGIIINDTKAQQIWRCEHFPLKGKAKSKWLTYFMAMRARVFDDWTREQLADTGDTVLLHIGCGMDSRALRIGAETVKWYDIDFPAVIEERRRYYRETQYYHMLEGDATKPDWIKALPNFTNAVVIMEGVSMYLKNDEVQRLFIALREKFERVRLLMDVYTVFGAKASKYKNPINNVGVTTVYGIDDPQIPCVDSGITFLSEHTMTPQSLVNELSGFDKGFFKLMFAGSATKKIYRLFEYELKKPQKA